MIKKDSRGDTIVEVMFAMAIIAVVLAAAYATASKNLQTSQFTKERTQATNIAEAQLEQLKILANAPDLNVFCIDIEAQDFIIDATDPNNCIESYYKKTITKTDNNYKIVVEWTPPGGTEANKANVTLYYSDYDFALSGSNNLSIATVSSGPSGVVLRVSIRNEASLLSSGVVYGTSSNPRVNDGSSVVLLSGPPASAEFTKLISFADADEASRIYYGRAFVTTPNGTFFSTPIRFSGTTLIGPQATAPIISSLSAATSVFSATVTGSISDGGSPVTSRVLTYYRLDGGGNPIDQQTASLNNNSFSQTLPSLTASTQYYYRIDATNSVGTTTSTVRSFTTSTVPSGVAQAGQRTDPVTGKISRYFLSTSPATCQQARQAATNSGGYLVTIGSAEENSFVAAFAGTYIWIGFSDRAVEGTWVWENGEFTPWRIGNTTPYTNWAPGEPNDYNNGVPGEDCAVMNWNSNGQWNDWYNNATTTARYVIEYELN